MAAADAAHEQLIAYVGRLNGNSGLYTALCAAQEACASGSAPPMSAEGARVAASLRDEFERGGVHLPAAKRERLHALQTEMWTLGADYMRNLSDVERMGSFQLPQRALRRGALPAAAAAAVRGGSLLLTQEAVAAVLSGCGDDALRHDVFAAAASTPAENQQLLLRLLKARADAALLLGFPSHSAYVTGTLLARTPAAPLAFCAALSAGLQVEARREMDAMLKQRQSSHEHAGVHAWDRDLLMMRARSAAGAADAQRAASRCGACVLLCAPRTVLTRSSHSYFTLHGAVEGLSLLVERLFGVTLRAAKLAPGEGWAPGVRKLTATHPDAGPLGCVYLDLLPRRHKTPGAAHFVIRAGRTGCADAAVPPRLASVALVASFGRGGDDGSNVQLSHGEVELLFHEAGHALHSLLSDTSYQHLSGTRGAQDVVEAPSTLVERLAWHPAALRSWARTPGSGEPIPEALVAALRTNRRAFAATECVEQVAHAAMDLALHGAAGPPPETLAEAAGFAAEVLRRHTPWPSDAANAKFEARKTHLVGYGGTYYAYLYGTALSGAAWSALGLEEDPLAPRAADAIMRHLLLPGGSADPAEAFTQLLGPHALRPLGGGWAPDPEAALRDVLRP